MRRLHRTAAVLVCLTFAGLTAQNPAHAGQIDVRPRVPGPGTSTPTDLPPWICKMRPAWCSDR